MAIKNITGNETPRPLRGKTHKSNRNVRFVDLNATAEELVKYAEESFIQAPANPSIGDSVVWNGTDWVAGSGGSGSEYTETIVMVTGEEFGDIANEAPIFELLPAPGEGKYYDYKVDIVKLENNFLKVPNGFILAVSEYNNYSGIEFSGLNLASQVASPFVLSGDSNSYSRSYPDNARPTNEAIWLLSKTGAHPFTNVGELLKIILRWRVITI
jgi:hypothetical protein